VAAVTADAYRDLELAALAAVAEAVLADLRNAALAIRALVGPVGADLYDANLANADLRDAILTRANLTGADLRDAILTRADLYGANLVGADLTNADLRDANLHDADLAQVLWSSGTLWPEVKASLMRDRSEELRPGVWRVVGSGNADAETEGPLVSVP